MAHRAMSPFQHSCVLLLLSAAALASRAASADVVPAEGRRYVPVGTTDSTFNYGWNPKVNFTAWAEDPANRVYEGDVLVFYYPRGADEVYRFSRLDDMRRCVYTKGTRVCRDVDGVSGCKVPVSEGTALFTSGMVARCNSSMQLAVEVAVETGPRDIVVGYPTGEYTWPWNPAVNYTQWMLNNTLYTGDVLCFPLLSSSLSRSPPSLFDLMAFCHSLAVSSRPCYAGFSQPELTLSVPPFPFLIPAAPRADFKYAAHMDEVYIVPTKEDYDACKYDRYTAYCNSTDGVGEGCFSNPLDNTTTYFLSGVYSHCTASQKLAAVALDGPTGA
ncbi:unnamed protein product [Closterium sp. NIES-64]|nr:unnamed protein product [Closterium sp. NIES-64]